MQFTKNWDTKIPWNYSFKCSSQRIETLVIFFKSCFNAAMQCRLPLIRSSALCKTNNAKRIRKAITKAWLKRCAMQNSCSAVRFSSIPPAEDCCCEHLHFLVLFYQGIFLTMQCVCLYKNLVDTVGIYAQKKPSSLPPLIFVWRKLQPTPVAV